MTRPSSPRPAAGARTTHRALGGPPLLALLCALALGCGREPPPLRGGPATTWSHYAGDSGGTRYSPADQIDRENVEALEVAWTYRTGELRDERTRRANLSFEATPILAEGSLYLCTPFGRVVALDPETGAERWRHDPGVDLTDLYNLNCRGVAYWRDGAAREGAACASRIFSGTPDAQLLALDARTGAPCPGFGAGGRIDLSRGVGDVRRGEYGLSSPPLVVGDRVVVGSMVLDNLRVDSPSGRVRAFDARSGAERWAFDPIPRDRADPARASWPPGPIRSGSANAWSILSADPERGLVFVPTGSASPDFYGGERLGDDLYADSVIALRASTGERVWHFQTVHHDLWDYDVPSQPVLVEVQAGAERVPAVAVATKTGNLFLLHRETGEPLFPVEERPVPQTTVAGERTSPTQPFPTRPPPLVPQTLSPEDAFGFTPWDRGACRERIRSLRSEGVFTPPSLEGSLFFPGPTGGSNWGSVAFDPARGLLLANTSRVAFSIRLAPREGAAPPASTPTRAVFQQEGTPYLAYQEALLSPLGAPCNPPPWGTLAAVDLGRGALRWEVPLGTTRDLAPLGIALPLGVPGLGGPIVTASGLVFVGAAVDDYLRAFDVETGEELWKGRLPAGGQATPMTYRARQDGRQFVVIAAGGHTQLGTRHGDWLVAFALPEP